MRRAQCYLILPRPLGTVLTWPLAAVRNDLLSRRGIMRSIRIFAAISGLGLIPSLASSAKAQDAPPDGVYVIFDGSGSMWGQLADGSYKIHVAKAVLSEFAGRDFGGSELALRAYGHRREGRLQRYRARGRLRSGRHGCGADARVHADRESSRAHADHEKSPRCAGRLWGPHGRDHPHQRWHRDVRPRSVRAHVPVAAGSGGHPSTRGRLRSPGGRSGLPAVHLGNQRRRVPRTPKVPTIWRRG